MDGGCWGVDFWILLTWFFHPALKKLLRQSDLYSHSAYHPYISLHKWVCKYNPLCNAPSIEIGIWCFLWFQQLVTGQTTKDPHEKGSEKVESALRCIKHWDAVFWEKRDGPFQVQRDCGNSLVGFSCLWWNIYRRPIFQATLAVFQGRVAIFPNIFQLKCTPISLVRLQHIATAFAWRYVH